MYENYSYSIIYLSHHASEWHDNGFSSRFWWLIYVWKQMVCEFLSFLIDAFSIEKFMKRDRKTVTELGNGTFNGEAGLQLHTVGIFQPIWIQYFMIVSLSCIYKKISFKKISFEKISFWSFKKISFSRLKIFFFIVREEFFPADFFQGSTNILELLKLKSLLYQKLGAL